MIKLIIIIQLFMKLNYDKINYFNQLYTIKLIIIIILILN
jgi:hypothetical protein